MLIYSDRIYFFSAPELYPGSMQPQLYKMAILGLDPMNILFIPTHNMTLKHIFSTTQSGHRMFTKPIFGQWIHELFKIMVTRNKKKTHKTQYLNPNSTLKYYKSLIMLRVIWILIRLFHNILLLFRPSNDIVKLLRKHHHKSAILFHHKLLTQFYIS